MAKKINPKDQTKALRGANLQLLNRNEPVKKCFEKIAKEKEDSIPREVLERAFIRPAVIGYRFSSETDFADGKVVEGEAIFNGMRETSNPEQVLEVLTSGKPEQTLMIGVDLTRTKEVIMAEFEILLDMQRERKRGRMKWLSIVDELLEVWDLHNQAGQQPWQKTFRQISKKVGRPLSTVKDQWYQAYEKIYHKPYDPESKYATEEKRGDAAQLCAKCPHGAGCYKKSGEWIPCSEYENIAGKERNLRSLEYRDNILYGENWREDSEEQ
ncbi:MAG: hypothetical protein NTW71_13025 [Deltaproteobacteria bacterium]|nr:hypothetical protein [Deltaproteobacteria bacterium]